MGCSAGETCGKSCSAQKVHTEQQLLKRKQSSVFGLVLFLFVLRWFHVVDSFLGVDVALLAIFIGAAAIFNRALDSLLNPTSPNVVSNFFRILWSLSDL